ncbi:hypothetical protein CY35_04G001100 [Sphagnum magellanicum]|nr:hypothetical protein CY35_04G001100 [Sphagnum magellanicum]
MRSNPASGCGDGNNQLLHQDWNCVHNFGSTHGEDTRNCCCRTVYHGVILGPESRNRKVDFKHMVISIVICLSFKARSIYWCILLRYTTEQIFSSTLGCFFTYLKIVVEAALKIAGVL